MKHVIYTKLAASSVQKIAFYKFKDSEFKNEVSCIPNCHPKSSVKFELFTIENCKG